MKLEEQRKETVTHIYMIVVFFFILSFCSFDFCYSFEEEGGKKKKKKERRRRRRKREEEVHRLNKKKRSIHLCAPKAVQISLTHSCIFTSNKMIFRGTHFD